MANRICLCYTFSMKQVGEEETTWKVEVIRCQLEFLLLMMRRFNAWT